MIHGLRFIVLQTILVAIIGALFVSGLLLQPFVGVSGYLCGGLSVMLLAGIVCAMLQRWDDVSWIATHILRVGLLGTVIGLIIAFSAAGDGISSDPEAIKKLMSGVIDGMHVALFVTAFGVASNLWLKLNMRLLGSAYE